MLNFTLENGSTLSLLGFGPLSITIVSGIDSAHVSRIPGNFGIVVANTLPDTDALGNELAAEERELLDIAADFDDYLAELADHAEFLAESQALGY